ncbi:MAG: 50S ribosomal protein L11 methyltransferase [Pseudomonadales bacterium]|nr:50S ribosomal protein L11 methyltransferase [Pseudomonadales bacterium]
MRVRLKASSAQLPLLEAGLEALGALAVTSSDAGDEPIVEPAPGETPLWARLRVEALFAEAVDPERVRAALRHFAFLPDSLLIDILGDADWQNAWRQHAVQACFGGRLWVLPRDAAAPQGSARGALLRLDPGLAFGTGSHPTTRLCLEWLATHPLEGLEVLDLGCGSGILALAALKLGCHSVHAIDHDPQALLATKDNAAYNALADERLVLGEPADLQSADSAGDGTFDLVVANILANPLIELAAEITRQTRVGGRIVLSGLLAGQAEAVQAAYPQMDFDNPACEADEHGALWARLEATRRI